MGFLFGLTGGGASIFASGLRIQGPSAALRCAVGPWLAAVGMGALVGALRRRWAQQPDLLITTEEPNGPESTVSWV